MGHLSGTDRAQLLLLPEAVDEYVGPDDPVRFRTSSTASILLKLHVSGYINRAIQPAAGGGGPSQHRSDLAAAAQRHLRTIGDLGRVSGRPSSRIPRVGPATRFLRRELLAVDLRASMR